MEKYTINNWEKIGDNLHRKNNSYMHGVYNIVSEEMIQMVNHNGKYIPQSEYDEIMDEITNQTYENLMEKGLADKKSTKIKKNLGTTVDGIISFFRDIKNMKDGELLRKYFL